jgi:hypothetical protein
MVHLFQELLALSRTQVENLGNEHAKKWIIEHHRKVNNAVTRSATPTGVAGFVNGLL